MKILYIANGNGTSPIIGGSLKRTAEISSRLESYGWKVDFLTTSGGHTALGSKFSATFHVVRSSLLSRAESSPLDRLISYALATFFSLFVILRLERFDLVYSDSDYFCDVVPAVWAKLRWKAKWIAMSHHILNFGRLSDPRQVLSNFSALSQRFSFLFFQMYADSVFLLNSSAGKEEAKYLVSRGVGVERIRLVMNGVDLALIDEISTGSAQSSYDACFIGGIRPRKGTEDLVSIWSHVVSRIPNALLLIIGGGLQSYERAFRERIVERGLQKNIVVAGYVPWKQLISRLKDSRLFISPSREEGWGMAVCEAMACGVPVVAYDLPAYRDFGESLARIPVGDQSAFADTIVSLLTREDLRMKMALLGKTRVAEFDWNDIAKRESILLQNMMREL